MVAAVPTDMARQLRIQFPGAMYHAMARGNARQIIFIDDDDRRLFLEELWKVCEHHHWLVWAYCLMPNHYHLLLETLTPTLSVGMRDLNGTYGQELNRRHARVGHVFQGRFVARLVDARAYLTEVSRYIVLNPVRAGLCRSPNEWRWSSYADVVGIRSGASSRLAVNATLALFGEDRAAARASYEQFVVAGIGARLPAPHPDNPLVIGDDAFLERVMTYGSDPSSEVPRPERVARPLAQVAADLSSRNEAIRDAFATGTYSQANLARHFGLHYSTVSRILQRGPRGRGRRRTSIQDVTPRAETPNVQLEFPDAAIQDVTP